MLTIQNEEALDKVLAEYSKEECAHFLKFLKKQQYYMLPYQLKEFELGTVQHRIWHKLNYQVH
ncbi:MULTISPECIES: hypothetical protein [Bacillus]|uniref:hypothetical protein n=1 Tax=Bacillus TaxID=1386 RepID=UPI00030610E7|nr:MULTISPECIES: hypothetical protein [Bacillus]